LAETGDGEQRLGVAAFGLGLLTDLTLPGAWEARPLREPIVRLRSATADAIADSWSGLEGVGWQATIDGAPFAVERGRAGDHRFVHGEHPNEGGSPRPETRGVYHLSADARLLQCAPSNPSDPVCWRAALDSVLFTIALLHGYEALHAGAVATEQGVIAVTASTGGGKSTLLSELLLNGLTLMADDVLVLERFSPDGPPLAHPAPPLMTVPATRLPMVMKASATARGRPVDARPPQLIASLEQERWIAVPVHPAPLSLRALIVLNRRSGLASSMRRAEKPLSALMDSLLHFPRTREREGTRFELAGAIAEHITIWRLDADPTIDPAVLAELLLAELAASSRDERPASESGPYVSRASNRY
jgi:hypothetical protein